MLHPTATSGRRGHRRAGERTGSASPLRVEVGWAREDLIEQVGNTLMVDDTHAQQRGAPWSCGEHAAEPAESIASEARRTTGFVPKRVRRPRVASGVSSTP